MVSIALLRIEVDLDRYGWWLKRWLPVFVISVLEIETPNNIHSLFRIGWYQRMFEWDVLFLHALIARLRR